MDISSDFDDVDEWGLSTDASPSRSPSRNSSIHGTPGLGDADDDNEDDTAALELPVPAPGVGIAVAPTAFDNYFLYASKPARTSASVFSQLVAPLSPEEHAEAIARAPRHAVLWEDEALCRAFFAQWCVELHEGFNLLFYGYGSKRRVLNAFAREIARTKTKGKGKNRVVVVNGFQPSFTLKDLLNAIEQVPEVVDAPLSGSGTASGIDAQTQRIYDVFAHTDGKMDNAPHLFLVIHNIEGPGVRAPKTKACLLLLALAPRIHIVASVDHIAAPSRFTLSELYGRKGPLLADATPEPTDVPPRAHTKSTKAKGKARADPDGATANATSTRHAVPERGFAWLWHDLTTLAPYDFELASADQSSITGVSALRSGRGHLSAATASSLAGAGAVSAGRAPIVSESAARHVLASVTQKARRLFVLLGCKQLELMPAADAGAGGGAMAAPGEAAYDYERLFGAARDEFVATSDTALRALLGEFRDHGLVVSTTAPVSGTEGEALWIPMRRDALNKIIGELKADGV